MATALRSEPVRNVAASDAREAVRLRALLPYLLLGACFGLVLVKSEAASWFRIQEMIRFRGFHLFGVLGSAVVVARLGIWLARRHGLRSLAGEPVTLAPKTLGRGTRYWAGGTIFGLGWTLTGACPGPFYALLGAGVGSAAIVLAGALLGAWAYGALRPHLPH